MLLLHRGMSGWRCSRPGSGRPATRGWTPPGRWRPGCTAGSLTGWAVGFVAFGAVTGGIAASAGDLLNSSPQLAQIINRLGGAGVLIDTFLAALGAYAGLLAGAYAISAALRMHAEEAAERVSPVLATAVGRTRWLTGHLLFALGGAALLLARGGVVTGALHGARIDDLTAGLDKALLAMADPDPTGDDHGRACDGDLRVVAPAVRGGVGRARAGLGVRSARPGAATTPDPA